MTRQVVSEALAILPVQNDIPREEAFAMLVTPSTLNRPKRCHLPVDAERQTFADVFWSTGPDTPTLCEGWTTRHLLAYLVQRDHGPLWAAPGDMVGHREPGQAKYMGRLVKAARSATQWHCRRLLSARGSRGATALSRTPAPLDPSVRPRLSPTFDSTSLTTHCPVKKGGRALGPPKASCRWPESSPFLVYHFAL